MERLTEKFDNSQYGIHGCGDNCKHGHEYCNHMEDCPTLDETIEKLGQYEDLEEQGKLLKLPCKVGDKIYAYNGVFGILAYEVDNIVIIKTITYQCSSYSEPIGDCPSECLDEIEPDISDFGKTVFLTKEEAEAALKKLNETEGEQ